MALPQSQFTLESHILAEGAGVDDTHLDLYMESRIISESTLKLIHKLGSHSEDDNGYKHPELNGQIADQLIKTIHNLHVSTQRWKEKAERHMRDYKALRVLISKPFVLALIDGDAATFCDELLAGNEDGGTRAAIRLRSDILAHVRHSHPEIAVRDPSVVVYYVLNIRGAASYLGRRGIIKAGEEGLLAFARGFAGTQTMCFVVDVRSGKDRADCKIKELLRFHAGLPQCAHVVFGPCHDKGYLPTLELYAMGRGGRRRGRREEMSGGVPPMSFSLLETTNTYPEFTALGLPMVSFPSVFRSQPRTERPPEEDTNKQVPMAAPAPGGDAASTGASRPLDPAAPCFFANNTQGNNPEDRPVSVATAKETEPDLEAPTTRTESKDAQSSEVRETGDEGRSDESPIAKPSTTTIERHPERKVEVPINPAGHAEQGDLYSEATQRRRPRASARARSEAFRLSRANGSTRNRGGRGIENAGMSRRGRRKGLRPLLEEGAAEISQAGLADWHSHSKANPTLDEETSWLEPLAPVLDVPPKVVLPRVDPPQVTKPLVAPRRVEVVDLPYYRESLLD